jgi:hypothetical protein
MVKGAKLEVLEDVLVTAIGQVNVKIGTATSEVVKEQVKVIVQQVNITDFVHKN